MPYPSGEAAFTRRRLLHGAVLAGGVFDAESVDFLVLTPGLQMHFQAVEELRRRAACSHTAK